MGLPKNLTGIISLTKIETLKSTKGKKLPLEKMF